MAQFKAAAGPLIDMIAFDQLDNVTDGAGNTNGKFIQRFRAHGAFIYLRGGETVQASRLEGVQPAVLRVRISANTSMVTTDWRCRDVRRNVIYAISGITHSIDRGYFDILVRSGVAP